MELNDMKQSLFKATATVLVVLICSATADVVMVPSSGIRTISQAIVKARSGDTVVVSDGVYKEDIFVKAGVYVKAQYMHGAIIDGDGRGTVVTLSTGAGIEGFEIRNGTIGIFSKDPDVVIKKNRVVRNWMSGLIIVRHCPLIEDNIIAFNRASGIVGWNLRASKGAIEHNTIAYNVGFGFFLGGASNVQFQYNTVAFNQKYGLKMTGEASASVTKYNNFWENLKQFYENPADNYVFDPAFTSPKVKYDFNPEPTLCCSVKDANGQNLGVRLKK
jgi:hypothetical protein